LAGKAITIFNRSEVIGRPLAVMMSNDGAMVLSFDEHGPLEFKAGAPNETSMNRRSALAQSDIIITGVPGSSFALVKREEVHSNSVCVNFSSEKNFNEDVESHVRTFIPRVGPMTVAMCMRNTIRLFENFHHE
jgi:5,10-methylene-tetrahydrofolate dehydrogenase/methenyl tetrahydrofolate cyclohydrolase